jgi:hypothetical protein
MPYFTKNKCVYKKSTRKKVGCTQGSVKKYLAALHANVKDSVNECMDYKNLIITDNKSEASVYYTLTSDPAIEIGLVFNLIPESYEKIEDELEHMTSNDEVKIESLVFNDVYNKYFNS